MRMTIKIVAFGRFLEYSPSMRSRPATATPVERHRSGKSMFRLCDCATQTAEFFCWNRSLSEHGLLLWKFETQKSLEPGLCLDPKVAPTDFSLAPLPELPCAK